MTTKLRRSRKHRRMAALLLVLISVLVAVEGKGIWLKATHPLKYEETIRYHAQTYQLDPLLVAAVINVESKFDPRAESQKGAKGLMQLLDDTAVWGAEIIGIADFSPSQAFEPEINIQIGSWYLAKLLTQYGGNTPTALAAYNGGSGNVSKWLGDKSLSKDGITLETIPFPETEAYVARVMEQYESYQKLYSEDLQ